MPYNFLKRVTAVSFLYATSEHTVNHKNPTYVQTMKLISSQNAILTNKMNKSIQDHICKIIFSDLTYIYCKIQAVLDGNTYSKIN